MHVGFNVRDRSVNVMGLPIFPITNLAIILIWFLVTKIMGVDNPLGFVLQAEITLSSS